MTLAWPVDWTRGRNSEPVIDLRSISCRRGQTNALHHVTFEIAPGELAFVTGVSGAGKSTLLGVIHGDLELTSGVGYVGGHELHERRHLDLPRLRRRVAMVYQDYRLLPRLTALENIVFAVRAIELRLPATEAIRRARAHLEAVGLGDKHDAYPTELSGGEQQRVAIARALACRPRILLADEPTGNLDKANASQVIGHLVEIARRGTAVLIATHDLTLVGREAGQHLRLENGSHAGPLHLVAKTG